ncbi:conserved hypothetical protein [Talaromyces stipitatus ATCC 10500]|uniref:Uncharacterized protein n=1 Tax=Talaromyces stipitatus (strain ATCC 10500 / CBS 375.48 / QM 6759 / NRRL 1006) TaxID=441959 RepID=B8LVC3_TALSN|nr:uncharacterized protein TSTA_066240 [Talaromyces stipitatus ATCC 10500]EED23173.1 conserved hypothetical protein [Talaromyces stipitatus ATCC 10500]
MELPQPQAEEAVSSNDRVGKKQRDREEEAGYIMDDLKSGKSVLLLQETPKAKTSHCQSWRCMPRKRTGKPVIKSHYRFMLKDISVPSKRKAEYYHVTCLERLLPDLSALVRDGHLKMDGWISAPVDSNVCLESSAEMVADWFKYGGRTFDLGCYANFRKDHREWDNDCSTRWINHHLGHGEQPDNACNYCQSLPDPEEPKKEDYFPDDPSVISLSQMLASMSGQANIDKCGRRRRRA